jgi:hypothetical protein
MEELKSILTIFFTNYYDNEIDWYHWEIKDNSLPSGIVLPNENRVTRNLLLKQQLNSKWSESDGKTPAPARILSRGSKYKINYFFYF